MNNRYVRLQSEELKKLLVYKNFQAPEMMMFTYEEYEQILKMCGFPESEIHEAIKALKDSEEK